MADQNWRTSPLFSGFQDEDLVKIDKTQRLLELDSDQQVFRMGDKADALLVVEAGRIALTLPARVGGMVRDFTIDELGPGGVLGWSALVAPYRYTRDATTLCPAKVAIFDRSALETLIATEPGLAAAMMANVSRVVARRLARVDAMLIRRLQRAVTGEFRTL